MALRMGLLLVALLAATHAGAADQPTHVRKKPRILIVSAEEKGKLKTGGLGDFTEGFRRMLVQAGYEADIALPGYESLFMQPDFHERYASTRRSERVPLDRGHPNAPLMEIYREKRAGRSNAFLFRHTESDPSLRYFHNPPQPGARPYYGNSAREAEEFGVFSKAVGQWAAKQDYDIVVINDWHTGLVAPAMKDAGGKAKVWGFVHNLKYQGRSGGETARTLRMSHHFHPSGIEFHGDTSTMKALFQYSDGITVVSRNHAQEITTPLFGEGLEGVAEDARKQARLTGIANGMDPEPWDTRKLSERLPGIAEKALPPGDAKALLGENLRGFDFSAASMGGKARGKKILQAYAGLPRIDAPVIALTARLDSQKGTDYVIEAIRDTVQARSRAGKPVQFVVIGDGAPEYKARLETLAADPAYNRNFSYRPFSEEGERLAVAYADVLANPSRYEPCGLNYMYGMSSGTLPLVSDRGGHVDLVSPGKTGFMFEVAGKAETPADFAKTRANLARTFQEVLEVFDSDPARIQKMRLAAMSARNSWRSRLPQYEAMMAYLLMDGPRAARASPALATGRVPGIDELLGAAVGRCAIGALSTRP